MSEQVLDLTRINPHFSRQIQEISGQDVSLCYQCGKCTAGCPIAGSVSPAPNQIIRLIQLGQEETVLRSHTIWYCLSCMTCSARCPKEVALDKIMDALREMVYQRHLSGKFPSIKLFDKAFLESIRKHGRLYELGAIMSFNLQSGKPFRDIELMQPMIAKGKLGVSPVGPKDKKWLEKIFNWGT